MAPKTKMAETHLRVLEFIVVESFLQLARSDERREGFGRPILQMVFSVPQQTSSPLSGPVGSRWLTE
jgi:hypothetical protein